MSDSTTVDVERTTVEVVAPSDVEVLDPGELSLDELAARINEGHRDVQRDVDTVVNKWVAVGESLIQARGIVEVGGWAKWVEGNLTFGQQMANAYIRCATYQDEIRAFAHRNGVDSRGLIATLVTACGGLPATNGKVDNSSRIREATQLRQEGATLAALADHFGVSRFTVREWVDPDAKERQRARHRRQSARRRERASEAKAAARALEQQRRAEAVRKIGGNGADCYGEIRKALARSQAAIDDASTDAERKAWREVQRVLNRAEAEALDALGVERRAA